MDTGTCVLTTSLIEAVLLVAGILALVDVAFREIPSVIKKFRAHFVINIAVTQIYYGSLGLQNAEIWLAWVTFLRSATGYVVVLYLLENFIRVLFVVADIGHKSTMDVANPLLKCWSVYRVFIVAFNIAVGVVFSVMPTNGVFIAHVAGNATSVTLGIFPTCIVLARLAYLIRQHQKQIEKQEREYAQEFKTKRLSDSEDLEAQKSKKSHKKNSPSKTQGELTSMQRAKDKSKIKKTERQLALFVVLVLICCIAWNYSNVGEFQFYAQDITGRWEGIECSVGFGQILHVVTSLLGLAITRAPNAKKRAWTSTSPWMTTVARVFSQMSGHRGSHNRSQSDGSADMRSQNASKKSKGHTRANSAHIGIGSTPASQMDSRYNSASASPVGSTFNSPMSSPGGSPMSSPRGSNADQFPPTPSDVTETRAQSV